MTATALHDKLASAHMVEYGGAMTAADFGDLRGEFEALRSGCGVFDLGWRAKIVLTGGDRVRWLNGMVTNNVRDLAVAHGVYAFLLNPQGHILGDLYAYNRGDYLLVDTEQAQLEKMLQVFDHYIIMDDVEVANVSAKLTAIGIAGPKSREVLHAAGLEIPELGPLQLAALVWQGAGATLVRGEHEQHASYEIWLAPEKVTRLWDALLAAGGSAVGTTALDLHRMALGIPKYGQDIRERDLPQETEQTRALNFNKGCYIGQEIVERIRSRGSVHRKFTGFVGHQPLPPPGTRIQAEGKDVGELTSVAALPAGDGWRHVALGYIRREMGTPGKEVEIGGVKATVTAVPFREFLQN